MKRNERWHCHGWANGEDYENNKPQTLSCIVFAASEQEADAKADDYFSRNFGGVEVVQSFKLKGTK